MPDRQTRKSAGDRYIVRLKDGPAATAARTRAMIAAPGVLPTHVYETVFPGFAAYLTPEALERLRQDPNVVSVERDRKVFLTSRADSREQRRASKASRGERRDRAERASGREPGQVIPPGIERIGGLNSLVARIDGVDQRVDVDVAVVDSGIDRNHPDLNVFATADCTGPATGDPNYAVDQDGHGTHVAGTIAALDNDIGVVGVAPGARIWSVRVVARGGGSLAGFICGMDFVTKHATDQGDGRGTIEVANMSVGAPAPTSDCSDGSVHAAFCRMVEAGIPGIVSAGNDYRDAVNQLPANFPEAITVSAIADKDGKPGGLGGRYNVPCSTLSANDDGFAPFSNYGEVVDISAPGMDIRSTWPTYLGPKPGFCVDGAYASAYGTSMSTPHVAGVAALLKVVEPDATPAQIRQLLLDQQEPGPLPDDPDSFKEGVVRIPSTTDTSRPSVTIASPRDGAKVKSTFTMKVNARDSGSGIAVVQFWGCSPECVLLGRDDTAPYALEGIALAAGKSHDLLAWAYDGAGNLGDSIRHTITVEEEEGKSTGEKPKVSCRALEEDPDDEDIHLDARPCNLYYRPGSGAADVTLVVEATVKGGSIASVAFPEILGAPGGAGAPVPGSPINWQFRYAIPASGLAAGAAPVFPTITATTSGNKSKGTTLSVIPDGQAPNVRIAKPKDWFATTGSVTVKIEADDPNPKGSTSSGLARVELFRRTVDGGGSSLGIDTEAPYAFTITPLAGQQSLFAVAYDNVGNRTHSEVVHVCGGSSCEEDPGPTPTPTPTPPPPGEVNPDDWRTAELASQLPFSQLLETAALSAGADDPECREIVGGPASRYEASAWYRVNLPYDAQLRVSTAGSLYQGPDTTEGPVLDTVLLVAVRSGSGWSVLQCADDANGQRTAELTIGIRRATDYYVMAGVFAGGPRRETGYLLVNMDDAGASGGQDRGARGREARRR